MKKLLIVLVLTLAMSALAFGFGTELGAGVNMISVFGIEVNIPTVAAGVNVPITGPFSITGQIDALFPPSNSNNSEGSSMAFMILGGGRYTFNMSSLKAFVGADGGVLTDFSGSSHMTPAFGVNAGAIFNMFYVKGAMRWLSITSSYELDHPVTIFLTLTEITGGVYFEF